MEKRKYRNTMGNRGEGESSPKLLNFGTLWAHKTTQGGFPLRVTWRLGAWGSMCCF